MTAKEMFEELGFKILTNNEKHISYHRETLFFMGAANQIEIVFSLEDREYYTFMYDYKSSLQKLDTPLMITMELHKSINKQVEELGWK